MTLLESNAFDKGNIKSFLFCAVELKDNNYSRTKYAEFTREINKRLFAPTVILFRAGDRLTVAFADRRPDKTDDDRDVLGQVTLIKDIRLNNPHRAHLDILSELSLEECVQWMNDNRKPKNFDGLLAAWLAKLRFFISLAIEQEPEQDAKFLLGILNSTTIRFYLDLVAETSGMGTSRWINNYVKEFPIPVVAHEQQTEIIEIVDQILDTKNTDPDADTTEQENEIDKLVYALYDLTPKEIAIVEKNV